MPKPGGDPCMRLSESSRDLHLSFVRPIPLFDWAIIPSSRPALRLRRLAVAPTLRHAPPLPGHTLTASSTTARLTRSGRSEGSPLSDADQSRHNLVFGGCKNPTMMQPCASAAKLRDGGPILPLGMTAMSHLGTPPPRTVIGDPVTSGWSEPKLLGAFSILRS